MIKHKPYKKPIYSFGSQEDFINLYNEKPERVCASLAKFVTGKRKKSAVNRLMSLKEDVLIHYALSVGFIHTQKVDVDQMFD